MGAKICFFVADQEKWNCRHWSQDLVTGTGKKQAKLNFWCQGVKIFSKRCQKCTFAHCSKILIKISCKHVQYFITLIWPMHIFCRTIPIFFLFIFSAFVFLLPSGLKSFDLYHWRTGMLVCFLLDSISFDINLINTRSIVMPLPAISQWRPRARRVVVRHDWQWSYNLVVCRCSFHNSVKSHGKSRYSSV